MSLPNSATPASVHVLVFLLYKLGLLIALSIFLAALSRVVSGTAGGVTPYSVGTPNSAAVASISVSKPINPVSRS